MRRTRSLVTRLPLALALALTLAVSASLTSCGGKSGGDPDLVLLSFNLPDISGIPLNQALILTFSNVVEPDSITLDTLRVVGATGPFFEQTIVDGNLVALLPRSPNFEDYSDAGLAPNTVYTVSMPVHPATATIRTPSGKQLTDTQSYFFRTRSTAPLFVEPRRAVVHGLVPSQGGRSDDEGCLQNISNALYVSPQVDASVIQLGSGPGASLLCQRNQGRPRAIEPESFPRHDQLAVGTPSAVNPGLIDMPAIRVKINEPLDPLSVVPYNPVTQIPANVQLWRVALRDGTPTGPDRIRTNKPILVQTAVATEIILVPAGPIQQGVYLINILPQVKDLPGNALRTDDRPNPAIGGYNVYETLPAFNALIPGGYRIYYQTLEVPNTALAIVEQFNSNAAEHGDAFSATTQPGLFTQSLVDGGGTPGILDGLPLADSTGGDPTPNQTHTYAPGDPTGALAGQTTTANWNEEIASGQGFRFLGIPTLRVNPDAQPGGGEGLLRAVWKPYTGSGKDGIFSSPGNGSSLSFNTDGGSENNDGIWEYESFDLKATDVIDVSGSKPLLILVRGTCTIDGLIRANGGVGGPGFNTDGTARFANAASRPCGGPGGVGAAGGGVGGSGANPILGAINGSNGLPGANLFGTWAGELTTNLEFPVGRAAFGFTDAGGTGAGSGGGGGGGFGTAGGNGTLISGTNAGQANAANGGGVAGTATFDRLLTLFKPDRTYSPFSNIVGGSGGGGGSADDDTGTGEVGNGGAGANEDDGGAGGGGGGGGICILSSGAMTVGATGGVQARGGAGGSTYSIAQLLIGDGDDGNPGTADDIIVGVQSAVTPAGDGGPGGGGSGGGILLIGRTVTMGGTLSATGGAGGSSGNAARVAGAGGAGRVAIISFAGQALPTVTGSSTPAAFVSTGASTQYNPSVDLVSVGQSEWVDLFTPTAEFAPDPDGPGPLGQQFPTFTSNFGALTGIGLIQGAGGDFDALLEFQGADDVSPIPSGATPDQADGLTPWVSAANITTLDFKRYFRWRWRFFVSNSYIGHGGAANPLPQVFDVEIQFEKS